MAAATSLGDVRAMKHEARRDEGESSLSSLRLPASDVAALRFLWSGLESQVGLGSNFGAMCQRAAERTVVGSSESARGDTRAPLRWSRDGEDRRSSSAHPGESFTSGGAEAIRLALAYDGRADEDLGGAHIHVHKEQSFYRVDQISKVEAWACWSNHHTGGLNEPLGRRADVAYHTLLEMVERDQKRHVVVLYLMYSDVTPASRRSDFGRSNSYSLGDLVPLAVETDTVLRHAKRLTGDLRRELDARAVDARALQLDVDSRRPCRCPVHADAECPQKDLPGFEERGCRCSGPAPHVVMLCPNRDGQRSVIELRHENWLRVRGKVDRRETVTPLEALHDLLDPIAPPAGQLSMADHKAEKARRDALRMRNATDIRVEAHAMLIQASKAYRSARAEVTR